jgi:hypothetical protein
MGIFDRFRFAVKPPQVPEKEKKPSTDEIGYISSSIYRGKDFNFYNPDELLINKGAGIYDRMMRDEQVKAVLRFKQKAVTSRGYYFDIPDKGSPELEKMAEFFTAVIENISGSWKDKLTEILSALKNGFAIIEKIYEPFEWDGRLYWGLRDLKLRPSDTFDGGFVTDTHGNLLEVNQIVTGKDLVKLPLDKIIHFVNQPDEDRFYGESDLKAVHRAWWSKDLAIKFQNIHLERHAHGFIYAKITEGKLGDPDYSNLEEVISNIHINTGMILPYNVDVNTIQPLSTMAYDKAVAMYDKSIAKGVLVPNLLGLSEQGQTGSYSQSQTQFEAFLWILDDIDSRLSESLNEQLFKQLALWNFNSTQYPHYKTEPISETQKLELAKGWAELISKGAATRTDADENHIRKQLNFPEKEEAEEGGGDLPPDEDMPVEIPALDDWINNKPEGQRAHIQQQFAEKPWLKRINFAKLERKWINQEKSMVDDLNVVMASISVSMEKQIRKIGGDKSWGNVNPKEIDSIEIPRKIGNDLRKALRINLQEALDGSYEQARRELPKKKYKRVEAGMDKVQADKYIQSKKMKIAGMLESEIPSKVKTTLENALKYDKSLKDTIAQLYEDLADILPRVDAAGRAVNVPARLENIARTNISDAVNQARM